MSVSNSGANPWPAGRSAAADLIRQFDWAGSPIGPIDTWPQSLRTSIDLMLPTQAEIVLFWGPEFIAFYNDAYAPTIGSKHPQALGRPAALHWSELWDDLGPLLNSVRASGETISAADRPFQINRHGYLEQVYFDISYSAVRDEAGAVAGVMCIVRETTERVRAAQALLESEQAIRVAHERLELALNAGAVLGTWVWDMPLDRITGDERFARTFSLDAAALAQGLPLAEVSQSIHPDDMAGVNALISSAIAQGGPYRAEYRVRQLDNSWLWIEANGHVEMDAQGRALRFPGVLINIDARKRAESARQREKSARHQAEIDLERASRHFEMAQSAGGIGIFSVDIATNMITATPEFCRLFGMPELPLMAAAAVEARLHPDDVDRPSNPQTRHAGSSNLAVEYRIVRADTGEVRWLSRRAEFVRDEHGVPVQLRGVVQDITERKTAETTLRESEARFRALAQAMPNQAWTSGPDGLLDWFNQPVMAYSGLNHDELAGEGWGRIVHPDDLMRAAQAWGHALATGQHYETEFRIRRRDGAYRWHIVRAVPVEDGGRVARWIGTNTDIDDHKNAQAQLASLNASLEQRVAERTRERDRMWRLSTDLMLVAGFESHIEAVNPAWTTVLGWDEAELVGLPFFELVHPDDLERTIAETRRLAEGHITLRFDNRARHKDGSYRAMSWTAVPDAHFLHAVGRDITEQLAAATALKEAEERLRQSQKMEAVGQLTGGIAHDFNNLLQGITSSLETVRRRMAQGRPAEVERFVSGAIGAAHRAAALTHRLLAFSRRQPLDPRAVKANPLVSSMEDLLRRTLGVNITLELVLAGGLWPTLCDPNQLENAILNLAINARDAMPDGGQLVIETANAHLDAAYAEQNLGLTPGQYVCVAVTDSGTGMSAEVMARAFDPFFTTKPMGQGTGLGLSMIYGFARQSEGYCKIYSELGLGTTVKLFLPRHHGEDSTEPAAPDTPAVSGSDHEEVVLVVEDEPLVRSLIVDLLKELGYGTVEASDGPSGLAILQGPQRVDLLVTDIGLPGLNGRQLVDTARIGRPGLKVLFMTGYAENAAIANGFLQPGMAMVTKPFAMDTLAARIRDMLS